MQTDEIIKIFKQANGEHYVLSNHAIGELERFTKLMVATERARCAKVAEDYVDGFDSDYKEIGIEIAGIIRARGEA